MTELKPVSIALVLGSGPSATQLSNWKKPGNVALVVINNAWRACSDWDYLVHAGDFPVSRLPESLRPGQQVHSHGSYVPAQNRYGGFVYGGGTMAFTAGYWALDALKPDVLAYFACDMTYSGKVTHFYGAGTADPLRKDVTLQSLEAKSIRLMALAARQGCACINLSSEANSRLMLPKARLTEIGKRAPAVEIDTEAVDAALAEEARLGYLIEDGEYWHHTESFDSGALSRLDDMWLSACVSPQRERRFA